MHKLILTCEEANFTFFFPLRNAYEKVCPNRSKIIILTMKFCTQEDVNCHKEQNKVIRQFILSQNKAQSWKV